MQWVYVSLLDGLDEGTTDGAAVGLDEGPTDGAADGIVEGPTDGIVDGPAEKDETTSNLEFLLDCPTL